MKKITSVLIIMLSCLLILSGCTGDNIVNSGQNVNDGSYTTSVESSQIQNEEKGPETKSNKSEQITFDYKDIPQYSGEPYVVVNNHKPFFSEKDYTTTSFEKYSPHDSLGRCGVAFANIGEDLMPTEARGSIGMVKPTGWHSIRYENVDGRYLYNRCHLIGFQLTGENANEENLITGTRYMNINGMLPFENMVADYVSETGNHVLYRATPIFEGDNLLASGVLMEGWSVEDDGEGICYNVFCYNVQPGIIIDYSNGDSKAKDGSKPYGSSDTSTPSSKQNSAGTTTYIANKNTKKFHYPYCGSVGQMKEKNKKPLTCTRDEAIRQGYSPCGNCNP